MKYMRQLIKVIAVCIITLSSAQAQEKVSSWIRINQLGYTPAGSKVAVLGSKIAQAAVQDFELIDATTTKVALKKKAGKDFGKYGPFLSSFRLDFTEFK